MLTQKDAYKLLHDGAIALTKMEQQGLRIDVGYLHKTKKNLTRKVKYLENKIKDSEFYKDWQKSSKGAVNIYSGKQLGTFLYKVKEYDPPKTTPSGAGSTDEESLKALNIKEVNWLLKIRKIKKIRDTYLKAFEREQVNGVIHPFFHLHLARTFRSSSDKPNWQNIPKRDKEAMKIIRNAIFPRKGYQLLELDYGQLEVRIAACYHKDPTMLEYIESGKDMHADVAEQIFMLKKYDGNNELHEHLRSATKNGFVFPQFYGDYFKNNAHDLCKKWVDLPTGRWKPGMGHGGDLSDHMIKNGIKSFNGFERHLKGIEDDFWGNRFPVYNKWKETWWKRYQKKGYFNSLTGFHYKGLYSRNDAINYPVQGSAFHVLLLSIIEGIKAQINEKWKTKIVSETHDSILFDVYPPELDSVINIMNCIMVNDVRQIWPWIITPLEIDAELCPVDAPWSKKEKYKF
ncbi:MAG: DNA polymerase [bacterium]